MIVLRYVGPVFAATLALTIDAVDPTCWASGLSYSQCCGRRNGAAGSALVASGDPSCWDDAYSPERCCVEQVSLATETRFNSLTLSAAYLGMEHQAASRCWPTMGPNAFHTCCDLHLGLHGNTKCFDSDPASSGNNGVARSFESCCLPALLAGLDTCENEWCMSERWSPLPIIGLQQGVLDHRAYVGMEKGRGWYEVGEAEFEFLRDPQGGRITPASWVLEIACGSGRLTRHLVPWLAPGRYRGMDKARRVIEHGYWFELSARDRGKKSPRFAASSDFEFELLQGGPPPNVSIAVSLITHLNADDIRRLLTLLRRFVNAGHMFFPTFVERRPEVENPKDSSATATFRYTFKELEALSTGLGWHATSATQPWHRALNKYASAHPRALRHSMLQLTAV